MISEPSECFLSVDKHVIKVMISKVTKSVSQHTDRSIKMLFFSEDLSWKTDISNNISEF